MSMSSWFRLRPAIPFVEHCRRYASASASNKIRDTEIASAVSFMRIIRKLVYQGNAHLALEKYRCTSRAHDSSTLFPNAWPRISDMTARVILRRRHVNLGMRIYDEMIEEGLEPSFNLRSHIELLKAHSVPQNDYTLLACVEQVFADPQCDENCFRHLIRFLWHTLKCPEEVLDLAVEKFAQTHNRESLSESSQMLLAQIRKDALIREHRDFRLLPTSILEIPERPPSIKHLRYFSHSRYSDPNRFYEALKPWARMRSGRRCCNALIRIHLVRSNYDKMLRIYQLMASSNDRDLLPNSTTFGLLFMAHRAYQQGRHAKPRLSLTPRQLFREMVKCVSQHPKAFPGAELATALDQALEVYMHSSDYAAAYVAIEAYTLYKAPVTLATYCIVLRSLLQRIRAELVTHRKGTTEEWSSRFLGQPAELPREINYELLKAVASFAKQSVPLLTPVKIPVMESIRCPTLEQVLDKEHIPFKTMGATSLMRILNRAILAADENGMTPPSEAISIAVQSAWAEMAPELSANHKLESGLLETDHTQSPPQYFVFGAPS